MSGDTWPETASIAVSRAANRTCDRRRHASLNSSDAGGRTLRIVLILCCVTVIYGDPRDKPSRGIKALQKAMSSLPPQQLQLGQCDMENSCDWTWNKTLGFRRVSASWMRERFAYGPTTDASKSEDGHFLWYSGPGEVKMWSKQIPRTGPRCYLEFWLYQVEMRDGAISFVIFSQNMTFVSETKSGNNNATWERWRFNVGVVGYAYRLFLEMYVPHPNSSIAVDNVRLVDCFRESPPIGIACTADMFRCKNGSCLNRTRVCDFTKDCADGEDEVVDCDKIPKNARCNFENGWCGWRNVSGRPLNWTLHRGATPSERTGPSYDHTYRNESGTYAFVDMSQRLVYGSRATLESSLYNPTPPYSSDPKSPYHQSCQIRFFYHKYGVHSGSLALYLVQVRPRGNHTNSLWWSYGDENDIWNNEAIALPDVRYRYFLQFEATRAYSSKGDVAIDDISLSPECFGIGVPPEVVGDFNYYEPDIESERMPARYPDFKNETVIRITTCGASGRKGPTIEQCAQESNGTGIESIAPEEDSSIFNFDGIQRWTAPRGEYYTLIGVGARGGKGSRGLGSTLGALVRGVIELQKGDQLYFMVGQEGTDACPKNLGFTINECQSDPSHELSTEAKVREVKKTHIKNGGGGGGGATVIFTLKSNNEPELILIAAGGGGLGLDHSSDDGLQHGRGPAPADKTPSPTFISGDRGRPGASWWYGPWFNASEENGAAMPLTRGGLGGSGCESENQSHGDGGFGGGGGGCRTGGGGGGYIGGETKNRDFGSGEGGYSYASLRPTDIKFEPAAHFGPGEVLIIPAISGCGCDYRCVALDQYLSETKCLCPQGWQLSNDSKSCIMIDYKGVHQIYIIPFVIVVVLLLITGICVTCYKRYQNQKDLLHRRQMMFGNGTELTAFHADTMMTEFNPNYEFAGNLYSFKDLPQIPRDYISLVKPLGQGAFGEVFQGVYKYRRGEEHPVAVKTLPSLSTTQAEADFMMEALIMSKFNHPNIVHFIGVSFDKHPRYIVLELLAGGDLKNFLREERPRSDRPTSLTMQDLIMCGYDVANGCKYMEDKRFIHRDIAARNCLLTTKGPGRTVKIADFGMARDIYRSDYYRKGGKAMLPIKWMPPESFLDGIFTTKTDVWAFGVLLWEIMSFGYMPYTGCANREVMSMVTSGGRLEKPAGCPDPIYGIMTRCWHPRPDDRPSFSTIAERIGYCLQDPDVINHPTPNFDILPICDREITIMRPDPEAECINVQSDLDGCGYMQPRVIDPRSVARRVGQAVGSYNPENDKSNKGGEQHGRTTARSTGCPQGTFGCNAYDSSTDTFERTYSGDNDGDSEMTGNYEDGHQANQPNRQDTRMKNRNDNIEDHDNRRNADNGNNRPGEDEEEEEEEEECHQTANTDNAITDRRNGNESTTTTDTNSDSLIAQSSDTPPDTTTNSSPNTRTCSPNRITGLSINANINNVNGMVKKNTLKATLSLDPSALCRDTIPYEKINTRTQRSSTPGSMELRKDSLSHELPREEECSC